MKTKQRKPRKPSRRSRAANGSVARLKALLSEAAGLMSEHHASHLVTFYGECPVCSKGHTEHYPHNIFGRIERAIATPNNRLGESV